MKTKVGFYRLDPNTPRLFLLTLLVKEMVYEKTVGSGALELPFSVNFIANKLYDMGYTPRYDQTLAGEYLVDLLGIYESKEFNDLIVNLKSAGNLVDLRAKDDGLGLITFIGYYH